MLKKIFCAAFLCAAIIFVGNAPASAKDVWVYTEYKGTEFYVMDDTIVNKSTKHNRNFDVKVKYVHRSGAVDVTKWSFAENDGMIFFCIDDGKVMPLLTDGTTNQIGQKVRNYCLRYLGLN